MKSIKKLFLGLLLLSSLSSVYANDVQFYNPSFDCSKVKKDSVEHMICTDNILSKSDEILKEYKQRINEICDYPVISGIHPICIYLEDEK
ncbi:lysozyme inhibitor LprI family protein [Aliarcobacter butzleri]|uniref:hypothetical protein n=1 Tax=Aliarcobacter butzleri TaxID=28197 RepID=UPI0021B3F682|nr:hypothetical protein [Aliarcobacter butzleri]MCT7614151.1 hypothetical protein [Aliarcobacter butzleri]